MVMLLMKGLLLLIDVQVWSPRVCWMGGILSNRDAFIITLHLVIVRVNTNPELLQNESTSFQVSSQISRKGTFL